MKITKFIEYFPPINFGEIFKKNGYIYITGAQTMLESERANKYNNIQEVLDEIFDSADEIVDSFFEKFYNDFGIEVNGMHEALDELNNMIPSNHTERVQINSYIDACNAWFDSSLIEDDLIETSQENVNCSSKNHQDCSVMKLSNFIDYFDLDCNFFFKRNGRYFLVYENSVSNINADIADIFSSIEDIILDFKQRKLETSLLEEIYDIFDINCSTVKEAANCLEVFLDLNDQLPSKDEIEYHLALCNAWLNPENLEDDLPEESALQSKEIEMPF